MMGLYNFAEPLAQLIHQLEKGQEFARAGGKTVADKMSVSKGITLLSQTSTFNEDIHEWQRQSAELKTWEGFKNFFQRDHKEQRSVINTALKRGYTEAVQNIYGVPPPPPEYHNKLI